MLAIHIHEKGSLPFLNSYVQENQGELDSQIKKNTDLNFKIKKMGKILKKRRYSNVKYA